MGSEYRDSMAPGGLGRHLALFGLLYGGYGCLSPFLPALLGTRGLSPQEIAFVLAAGGLVRLIAGPIAGRLADRRRAPSRILGACAALAALAALAHLGGYGFWPLLCVALVYAAGTAPLAPLADALALSASQGGRAFQYGWVRGAGSAAFIAATIASGWLVQAWGLTAAIGLGGVMFLALACLASSRRGASAVRGTAAAASQGQGFGELIRLARFRRTVLAAALVVGAHALHDAFSMILWREAGLAAGVAGLLWSEAVAAEVAVFLLAGPWLLARLGLAGGLTLAAGAGALRWAAMAHSTAVPVLAATQVLHGLSFALLHLACLGLIEAETPAHLRATALTLYGTVGLGLAGIAMTLASGSLYAAFGAQAFWVMAALSLAALPVALSLRGPG